MYPSQNVYLAQITSRTPTKRSWPNKDFWPRATSSTPCDTYARWLECHLACCFGHGWVTYRGGSRIFPRRGCTTKKFKGIHPLHLSARCAPFLELSRSSALRVIVITWESIYFLREKTRPLETIIRELIVFCSNSFYYSWARRQNFFC